MSKIIKCPRCENMEQQVDLYDQLVNSMKKTYHVWLLIKGCGETEHENLISIHRTLEGVVQACKDDYSESTGEEAPEFELSYEQIKFPNQSIYYYIVDSHVQD